MFDSMVIFKFFNIKWVFDTFFCFYGGGGGGSAPPSQQTAYQVQMPESLVPYAEDIAKQAQRLSARRYTPYRGERIAGMSDAQISALEQTKAMGPSQYYPAAGLAALQGTQEFGMPQAQVYMSPYQQAVTDIAKREATAEGQQALQQIRSAAARAGAFGGSRQGLIESQQISDIGKRLSDIQTAGSQRAYESAQQQFERDRQAKLAGAGQLAAIGGAQQQAEIQRLQALERAGTLEQAEKQRLMDLRYQDFLRQQEYPYQQLNFYSSAIRGLGPISPVSTQSYQAPPSPFQQMLGLGVAGLGAYLGAR
jgi:hypothetical protein